MLLPLPVSIMRGIPRGGFPLEGSKRIAKAAGIIMLGNIISRLLGLVREQVIGAVFGTTAATDAFTVASTVPTMVYDLLVSGAISAALIPIFADYADTKDREELSRIVSVMLTIASAAMAVVVGILLVFAPVLASILGSGYDQDVQAVITYLIRLMLPAVLFMGTSGILTAALYARQSFTLPAFSVAVYNLGIILGAVLLSGQMGVTALVAGVLVGAFLQVAIQLPGMGGIRIRPRLDLSHPGVRAILKLYAPVALGLIVSNIGVIIDRNLASQTGEGSIAAMRFATTLVQFPLGLVATATSFAVLPTLARAASGNHEIHERDEKDERGGEGERGRVGEGESAGGRDSQDSELRTQNPTQDPGLRTQDSTPHPLTPSPPLPLSPQSSVLSPQSSSAYAATLKMGMKMILVLIVPAAVGLAVLREPIVQLLFERGAFDQDATALTALAFLGYAPGIAFSAVDQLLIFAFYARKDTRTPVLVGVMAIFVYLGVALTLIGSMGMLGLVLANSAQWISHALVLLWLLDRRVAGVLDRDLATFLIKVVGAAVAMGLVCWIALGWAGWLAATGPGVAILVAGEATLGAAVYAAAVTALRVPEAAQAWGLVAGKLRRRG